MFVLSESICNVFDKTTLIPRRVISLTTKWVSKNAWVPLSEGGDHENGGGDFWTGQNLLGTRAGTIDRGEDFLRDKKRGRRPFLRIKIRENFSKTRPRYPVNFERCLTYLKEVQWCDRFWVHLVFV